MGLQKDLKKIPKIDIPLWTMYKNTEAGETECTGIKALDTWLCGCAPSSTTCRKQ